MGWTDLTLFALTERRNSYDRSRILEPQHIPEYYPTMYQDGYTPSEILTAARKKLLQMRQAQTEYPQRIHITVETRVKK